MKTEEPLTLHKIDPCKRLLTGAVRSMSALNETRAIHLGLTSAEEKNELGVLQSLDFLTELGTGYINKRLESDAKRAICSIKDIGKAAARKKMEEGAFTALVSLERMAKAASGQKMEDAGISIVHSLCAIGKTADEQEMEMVVRVAAAYLGEIGNSAALHKRKREVLVATLALGTIGKNTTRRSSLTSIENLGRFQGQKPFALTFPAQESEFNMEVFPNVIEVNPEHAGDKEGPEMEGLDYANYFQEAPGLENSIIQTAYSLENSGLEADSRYLMIYLIMAKTAFESINKFENINEAEKLE